MNKYYADEMTEQLADEILDRAYWDSFCKEQYTILYREDEQNPKLKLKNMYSEVGDEITSLISYYRRSKMIDIYHTITNKNILKISYIDFYKYKLDYKEVSHSSKNINIIIDDFLNLIFKNTSFIESPSKTQQLEFLNKWVNIVAERNPSILQFDLSKLELTDYSLSSASLDRLSYIDGKYCYGYISNYEYQKFSSKYFDVAMLINDLYNYGYKYQAMKLFNKFKDKHILFYINLITDRIDTYFLKDLSC